MTKDFNFKAKNNVNAQQKKLRHVSRLGWPKSIEHNDRPTKCGLISHSSSHSFSQLGSKSISQPAKTFLGQLNTACLQTDAVIVHNSKLISSTDVSHIRLARKAYASSALTSIHICDYHAFKVFSLQSEFSLPRLINGVSKQRRCEKTCN